MAAPPPFALITPDLVAEHIVASMDETDVLAFAADLFEALRARDEDLAATFAVSIADASEIA